MRRLIPIAMIILACLLGSPPAADAQSKGLTYIEIILDCSESMKRHVDGLSKFAAAKAAVIDFVNKAPADYRFALRIMGGSDDATFYASNLIAGMGQFSKFSLIDAVKELEAGGQRSLYYALSDCLYDFPEQEANNLALIITDGIDEGGLSLADHEFLYGNDPHAPRLYFFGLDVTDAMVDEFRILTAAAGGKVFDVPKPDALTEKLEAALEEFSGNLAIYLYDGEGQAVNGEITIYDDTGNRISAEYDSSVLVTEVPGGIYRITAKYKGELKESDLVDVSGDGTVNVKFVFMVSSGNVRVILLDSLLDAIKGQIKVLDMYNQTVYEAGPDDYFALSLPEGTYQIEATAGGRIYIESGVLVTSEAYRDIEIIIPVIQSVLEVEVNNIESIPVNAHIRVYTPDGFMMGEAQYASYFHITLPPDDYTVVVEVSDERYEQDVYLTEGDQVTLSFDVNVPVGYLIIELRTDSGHDAWGQVRIFDEHGRYQRHWSIESEESPDWAFELPEGIYRVEAEVEGIISSREGVRVVGNQETRITLRFPDYIA